MEIIIKRHLKSTSWELAQVLKKPYKEPLLGQVLLCGLKSSPDVNVNFNGRLEATCMSPLMNPDVLTRFMY